MITVKISKKEEIKNKIDYPYLGINKDGLIVLFTEERTGVVLQNIVNYPIGHISDDWYESSFTPFENIIALQND